jgi:lipoprotein-anchoring transpeptidase ErfK/SrfK
MYRPWLIIFATAGLASAAPAATAAQLGAPVVIPGIGPANPQPSPQIQQVAASEPSPYGGGFLEMLITGRSPGPAPRYYASPVPRAVVAYSPAALPQQESVSKAVDPRYARQEVEYDGRQAAGTIVIDTPNKFLYLVEGRGRALRYGIGVGRPGFEWSGVKSISRKAEWPDWTPPAEMLLRRPDLPRHMAGGPANPLGSRALYLGSSLYRIHGTNEPETIGTNVSSGCIRMLNEDVMDLYYRVPVGTKVIVM